MKSVGPNLTRWYLNPFDGSGRFQIELHDVPTLAAKGAGVTVLSSASGLIIQIVSTMLLARLLSPADFGLVTMVTTFSLLFMNFGLNGFTEAVLQADEFNHQLATNLFWINISVGLLLTLGFAASGALLAHFYRDSRLLGITVAMAGTILITSASVQHLALLKRAMRFSATSAIDVASRAGSVLLAIVLGWLGFGYWALVAAALAQAAISALGGWTLCHWLPGIPKRAQGTGLLIEFAINTYGRFSINYAARNMDNFLVGWRFGAYSLGFYKKAYDLFALSATQSTAPLTNVAVSALSRFKEDRDKYKHYLLTALSVMAFAGMGLTALLTLIGPDLIRVLMGPGWEVSGRIFMYFGPGIGAMVIYHINGWIHLSIGRADRWFRWGLVEVVVTALLFIAALPWGPAGIGAAWTISFWVLMIPSFWYALNPIQFGISPVIGVMWRYVVAAPIAGFGSAGIIHNIHPLIVAQGLIGAMSRIAVSAALVGTLYLGAVILLHGGLAPLFQFTKLLRKMGSKSGQFSELHDTAVAG